VEICERPSDERNCYWPLGDLIRVTGAHASSVSFCLQREFQIKLPSSIRWETAHPCLCVRDRWMARASCNGGQTNCDWIATCDVDSNETSCSDKSLDTGREEYIYSWSGVFDTVCRIMSSLLPGGMLVILKNCQLLSEAITVFRQEYNWTQSIKPYCQNSGRNQMFIKDDPNLWAMADWIRYSHRNRG